MRNINRSSAAPRPLPWRPMRHGARRWRLALTCLLTAASALALLQSQAQAQDAPPGKLASAASAEQGSVTRDPFMRGMTVSCPGAGKIWGTSAMGATLDALTPLGVDWVALHPYAWIRRDGEVRFQPAAETGYLDRAVAMSRAAGISLFWKPHLGYWGSFEWRGEIAFGDDERAWQRFFADYKRFIVDHAAFAQRHELPLFAVGVELEATMHREKEWREVIAAVREVYSGTITYAPNWDGVERVPFWDALDLIGVQAYFPLSQSASPTVDELVAGWKGPMDQLRALSERHDGKQVVFTEIGYNRSGRAASEPWSYDVEDSAASRALRRKLIDVSFEVTEREPLVAGIFWWKWMPGNAGRSDFSMRDEEALAALRRAWGTQSTQTTSQ